MGSQFRQAENAISKVPTDVTHCLSFERLMVTDRDRTLMLLLGFVEWQSAQSVRCFFHEEILAGKAHVGRWPWEILEPQRPKVARRYQQIVHWIRIDGIMLP